MIQVLNNKVLIYLLVLIIALVILVLTDPSHLERSLSWIME
jgi:hypothetical protein